MVQRQANDAAIRDAAALLRNGGLVAFPTETVYGLGADATNDRAVARIFEAKGRPQFNPLIVHALDIRVHEAWVTCDDRALALAAHFWPGALTLVLPRRQDAPLSLLVSAGLETVAVRVPDHPVARSLLAAAEIPIAAPSANRSGRLSPTTAAHVADSLGDGVDMILDGGACAGGLESTVLSLAEEVPTLLRPGLVTHAALEAVIGSVRTAEDGAAIAAPGMMRSHYAPAAALRLNATAAQGENEAEALLAFGPDVPADFTLVQNLSATGDPVEAAANLFRMLHDLDRAGPAGIAIMPIPDEGLGVAINDRLKRAAHRD